MWRKNIPLIVSDELEKVNYGSDHPMQPERISMVFDILNKSEILAQFALYTPYQCSDNDLKIFHSEEYVNFLKNYSDIPDIFKNKNKFKIGCPDVPGFDGFYSFAQMVAGSSLLGAELLCGGHHNVVLNWIGGFHHAKESEASGFCYVNDCVLAIKRMLYDFQKVLYIDIDVHHGDGVEEAFLDTNRVLTLSFHQYGDDFFPGTGNIDLTADFKNNLNVPLRKGCSDENFEMMFKTIVDDIIDVYRPDAIVMQCGADCLKGDKLGMFNLSFKTHADAVQHVYNKNLPTLFLGGGGYTKQNVAKIWALESANMIEYEMGEYLPDNLKYKNNYSDNRFYYQPEGNIKKDLNSSQYLYKILYDVKTQLKSIYNDNSVGFLNKPYLTINAYEDSESECSEEAFSNIGDYSLHKKYFDTGKTLNIEI